MSSGNLGPQTPPRAPSSAQQRRRLDPGVQASSPSKQDFTRAWSLRRSMESKFFASEPSYVLASGICGTSDQAFCSNTIGSQI